MADFTDLIRDEVTHNNYRLSNHAIIRMGSRKILEDEVIETILSGEVIERFPNSKPCPTCLFMHPIRPGQPLYVVCAYVERDQRPHIITTHWFDPEKWIDWRTRRQ